VREKTLTLKSLGYWTAGEQMVKTHKVIAGKRRINRAVWLPTLATIGAVIWFFIFVILD